MELSNVKTAKIKKNLKEKNVSLKCNECGGLHNNFDIMEYQLLSHNRDEISFKIDGEISYKPVFFAICPNCGSIKMFDLILLIGKEEATKI